MNALRHLIRPVAGLAIAVSMTVAAIFVLVAITEPAAAQQINLDFGDGGEATGRIVQIVALITVLSLAPSILVMVTSFIRIVVVLSFLRTAIGTQQTPPNQVLVSLALFLTFFIMLPTFERTYDTAIKPMIADEITEFEAFDRATIPFRDFMIRHVREQDLNLFIDIAGVDPDTVRADNMALRILIPAFMISELRRAFEIGFLIFLPFLIIDMVVASVLMAMGMMMLPPIIIALPFKIIFFVLVDGWYMIVGSLVRSFGTGG